MRKLSITIIFASLLFYAFTGSVSAELITINKDGDIVWKVLSEKDIALEIPRHSYIEVKSVAETESKDSSNVQLSRKDNKVSLLVATDSETRELDVSNWSEEIIEIEERPEVQKLSIGVKENKFSLENKGIVALTDFPINIDSKSARLSVETSSGIRYLSVFPYEAVKTVLRTNLLNKVSDNNIEIVEEDRELQYIVEGEKILNFAGIYNYSIPVTAKVSASTGEILFVDAPVWYKVVGLLVT